MIFVCSPEIERRKESFPYLFRWNCLDRTFLRDNNLVDCPVILFFILPNPSKKNPHPSNQLLKWPEFFLLPFVPLNLPRKVTEQHYRVVHNL